MTTPHNANWRQRRLFLATVVVGCWLLFGASDSIAVNVGRPNVLIITADNLGYGDLSVFNPSSPILTPHLNQLATEGVRLTDFYTASPTCTVSRACLLTGRVADRHGLTIQLPGLAGNYGPGLDSSEILISQLLRDAGYHTGCFGKWNIGFAEGSRPTERGFDEFFGHASGNIDYYTHKYNGRHDLFRGIEPVHVEGYSTDLFADAASAFIRGHSDEPWFVYLPFNAPHFPNARNKEPGRDTEWQAPDAAFARYGYDPDTTNEQQRYHAVVTALDSAIGRVMATLHELNLDERTFVFFFADNGAFMLEGRGLEVSSNAPLRDGGVTCWEGGVRVAALARWTGRIDAGSVASAPMWSPDLLPTVCQMAEAPLPTDRVFDGVDILPDLTQSNEGRVTRSFYFTWRDFAALRMDNWKILRTKPNAAWQLFDLHRDIGEAHNVSQQYPRQLNDLTVEFHGWQSSIAQEQQSETRTAAD